MSGLRIRGLVKSFGEPPRPALAGIDLSLASGSLTAVVGPSGSGKSTLLRIVGGLTDATAGLVEMDGRSPGRLRADKEIGWMAQRPALLPWRTVIDNVAMAQAINPRPGRDLPEPAELVTMVGLAEVAGSYPERLSGGMQQRVALARTLAIGARLWLMDEPFSSLDELTRETLAEDMLRIWSQVGPTTLWVTHHIPEAVTLADRIVVLTPSPGRIAGVLEVDLPRPRDVTSMPFQEVVASARGLLRSGRPREVVA